MQITRVELENIKNHRELSVEFLPGTNAICGPNGAGKTTILEAISFALFGYLPCTKDDFTRRGEKVGVVRVSFLSSLDDREYTVVRNTKNTYYIYDPATKLRVAERKEEIQRWLYQHLGIEETIDLTDFFVTTLGVPQGDFTADFKKTPAQRKAIFDRVLRVEEYAEAADQLREFRNVLAEQIQDLDIKVAADERELEYLPLLQEKQQTLSQSIQQLHDQKQLLCTFQTEATSRLHWFEEVAEQLRQMGIARDKLLLQLENIEERKNRALKELDIAIEALRVMEQNRESYTQHQAAQRMAETLDAERRIRDTLLYRIAEKDKQLVQQKMQREMLQHELDQIAKDCEEIDRLMPQVKIQEQLEEEQTALQRALGQYRELQKHLQATAREFAQLTQARQDQLQAIAALLPFRAEAEQVDELETRLEKLRQEEKELLARQSAAQQWQKQEQVYREQLNAVEKHLSTLLQEQEALRKLVPIAAKLTEYEARDIQITTEIADLKAQMHKDQEILAQLKGGLCPLLAQRCLNMPAGQGLDDYFRLEVKDHAGKLNLLTEQQRAVRRELQQSKKVALKVAGLKQLENQITQEQARKEQLYAALAQLDRERAYSVPCTPEEILQVQHQIRQLEASLRIARESREKYNKLPFLQQQLQQIETARQEKEQRITEIQTALKALENVEERLQRLVEELTTLQDPRGKVAGLLRSVMHEGEKQQMLALVRNQEEKLSQELQELQQSLAPFHTLDQRWEETQKILQDTMVGHQLYLTNQQVALHKPEREREVERWETALQLLRDQYARVNNEMIALQETYSPEEHHQQKQKVQELREQIVRIEQQHLHLEKEFAEVSQQRTRLEELAHLVAGAIQERTKLRRLLQFVEVGREILKEAGPYITQSYLHNISHEADRIYREIAGDHLVNLRWDHTYEVILSDNEGRERSFHNLSGGEQMTAALALRLALLREISDIDVAFFDEPTTNLDEERRRNLAEQIRLIKGFRQLFVISHDDTFERVTDHVIRLGERKDFTREILLDYASIKSIQEDEDPI